MRTTFKIHFLFYVLGFLCFITGLFKDFIILSSIILFHELGHVLVGMLFNWPIEKIIILPFGGLTIFNQRLNASLIEEFLIAIAGFVFQIFFYNLLNSNILTQYHYSLLIFNLIPIYPLDGSKILNIFLNKVLPFQNSYLLTLIISLLSIITLSGYIIYSGFNLFSLVVLLFLFNKILLEYKNIKYTFNKFLLERYLYNITYKKTKKVKNVIQFYKERTHLIKNKQKYEKESEILRKMFDKNS